MPEKPIPRICEVCFNPIHEWGAVAWTRDKSDPVDLWKCYHPECLKQKKEEEAA